MNYKNKILFDLDRPLELGIGLQNVGNGVHRCGHIPMHAKTVGMFVEKITEEVSSQAAYLSKLYGREIRLLTFEDVKKLKIKPLIVPYITAPEVEEEFSQIDARLWGLPSKLTHAMKNKSEFYRLVKYLRVEDFNLPEYTTTYLAELIPYTKAFLKNIEQMYTDADMKNAYPLGVVLRAADEDENFGSSLMYEKGKYVVMIPNGDVNDARVYGNWEEALVNAKRILAAAMHLQKEPRVIVSRYIDTIDSPGMSVVVLKGNVYSLGWNMQSQKEPSRNPVAAGTYRPTDPVLKELQSKYEAYSAKVFERYLRRTAEQYRIDFNTIEGIVNIDIIIPSELEKSLQKKRGNNIEFYFTECNPRWTTYTDAIMTVLNANRLDQTVNNMLKVIKDGIAIVDKYKLPNSVDPSAVRAEIYAKDQELQKSGTRIICRMATNPMGIIYTGDVELAQAKMRNIIKKFVNQTEQPTSAGFLFS